MYLNFINFIHHSCVEFIAFLYYFVFYVFFQIECLIHIKRSFLGSFSDAWNWKIVSFNYCNFSSIGKLQTQPNQTLKFILSQKKNAQLVFEGYVFNKKITQANGHTVWRCVDVAKKKCHSRIITKNNVLVKAWINHSSHIPHSPKLINRTMYDREDELDDLIVQKPNESALLNLIETGQNHYTLIL